MSRDLTTSVVARQNVLNNSYAVSKLEEHLVLGGLRYEGETIFTKSQVAEILAIDERTVDRYLSDSADKLHRSGYQVLKGKVLKNIKLAYVYDTSVVDIIDPKSPSVGVFTFGAALVAAVSEEHG